MKDRFLQNMNLSDEGNENEDEVFAFVTENVNQSIQKDKKQKVSIHN